MESRQTTETKLIEIEKLERSPLNARRTERMNGLSELKASILAHGLMQNLVVTANGDGRYHVIAGGRRLQAIRSLREEGHLPDGYAVPCQVVADEHAEELSLAENVVRVAMHPADEFEAFAGLVEKGLTTTEVAERFGATEKHVQKRLKLARVAPELVGAYRAGSIDLECLMAFTVTNDRAKQLSVYGSLHGWQKGNASHIRSRLTETMVKTDSKFAKFVGLRAYEAAGGKTRSDLFGEEVFLEDPEVLDNLVKESLSEVRRRLEVEGWGWIEVSIDRDYAFVGKCGRLRATPVEPPPELVAERARLQSELDAIQEKEDADESPSDEIHDCVEVAEEKLEEIESRLREFVSFDPRKMKSAGCYVTIDHGGRLFIERGLVRKKDEKKLAKSKKGGKAASPEPVEQISEALRSDLKVYRLQVAQLEIAVHPEIAFDLLVFHVASSILGSHYFHDGPDVRFGSNVPPAPRVNVTTVAAERFESFERRLSREWLKAETEAEQFEQFRTLADEEKRALLAYCTATALRPKLAPNAGEDVSAYDIALSSTGANVADSWRPSKENYFGRLTREQLLAIGEELLGKEWAVRCGGFKKGKLAEVLGAAFSSPAEHGETPEQVEKLKSWLPSGMAFGVTLEPRPVKARKTKKAA